MEVAENPDRKFDEEADKTPKIPKVEEWRISREELKREDEFCIPRDLALD